MTITASAILVDNGYGTIGAALATGDTTLTFTTGHGTRFPAVASGQVLMCCILNSNNVLEEIAITLHTAGSDTATMARGQNGTVAKAWNAGDRIEARISSEVLKRLQVEAMKEIVLSTADAGATYTGSISPTGYGLVSGLIYAMKVATTNSGATPTINLSSLGAVTVVNDAGSALFAGQMPIHGIYKYDGTNFILMNAANAASLTKTNQVLSGGATVTAYNAGTLTTGTITINPGNGPLQYLTINGTGNIGAPTSDGSCSVLLINGATPGTSTFVGWTVGTNTGETLTTATGQKFITTVQRINGTPTFTIKALQ